MNANGIKKNDMIKGGLIALCGIFAGAAGMYALQTPIRQYAARQDAIHGDVIRILDIANDFAARAGAYCRPRALPDPFLHTAIFTPDGKAFTNVARFADGHDIYNGQTKDNLAFLQKMQAANLTLLFPTLPNNLALATYAEKDGQRLLILDEWSFQEPETKSFIEKIVAGDFEDGKTHVLYKPSLYDRVRETRTVEPGPSSFVTEEGARINLPANPCP